MRGGLNGRYKNVYLCFYLYYNTNGYCSSNNMIEALFELEDTFKEWTVSIEFLSGSFIILGINLINYIRA